MQIHQYYKLLAIPMLVLGLQSCFVAQDYQQPTVVASANFRTDALPEDSVTLADVSWRDMFTDPLLSDYIEKGLEHNIDVRIALQQIVAAEAYFKQGKQGFLPTLSGNAQVTHQELSRNSQFGSFFDGGITQYELSGMLSWEADIWGRIRSTRRAFEAGYLQTVAAHKAVKTQLITDIASSYYRLLSLDEQLEVAQKTIENREVAVKTTEALKTAGLVSDVAVKQTEAQLHTASALLVGLKRDIRLTENTLSILLGEEPTAIERTELEEQIFDNELSTGFPAQLLRNRPDVIAAEFNLVNAFELSNVARSAFYPSLTISATGGLQSLELDRLLSINSLFANVIGGLAQPILNGRRIRTQYEVALSQEEQALLNFRQSILNASKEVSDALYSYEAAQESIAIRTLEFEAYDIAISDSEALLNNGLANYLEVLTARENALNSELGLIDAQFNQLNAVVNLYRSLGGGWQ